MLHFDLPLPVANIHRNPGPYSKVRYSILLAFYSVSHRNPRRLDYIQSINYTRRLDLVISQVVPNPSSRPPEWQEKASVRKSFFVVP